MILDEAIIYHKKVAEVNRDTYECLLETSYQNQMQNKAKMDSCKQRAEHYGQLAQWLEELRRYKFTETPEQGYKRGFNNGYNKATRDFVNTCEKRLTDMILSHQGQLDFASGLAVANRMLDEVAQQLKAGEDS